MATISPRIGLLDLNEHLVLMILDYCSIRDLTALSQTCRCLDLLASSRNLWRPIAHHYLDYHEHMSDLPGKELKAAARRIVQGPQSWNNGQLRVDREYTLFLKPHDEAGPLPELPHVELSFIRLLPGGCHLVVMSGVLLECWDVRGMKRVWRRARRPQVTFNGCACEAVGDNVVMLVVSEFFQGDDEFRRDTKVIRVDLNTGEETEEYSLNVPYLSQNDFGLFAAGFVWRMEAWHPFTQASISGDYAVASSFSNKALLLFNWRTGRGVILEYNLFGSLNVDILNGHVAVLTTFGLKSLMLHLIPILEFEPHLSEDLDIKEWKRFTLDPVDGVQGVNGQSLTLIKTKARIGHAQMVVERSPLRDDQFMITAAAVVSRSKMQRATALFVPGRCRMKTSYRAFRVAVSFPSSGPNLAPVSSWGEMSTCNPFSPTMSVVRSADAKCTFWSMYSSSYSGHAVFDNSKGPFLFTINGKQKKPTPIDGLKRLNPMKSLTGLNKLNRPNGTGAGGGGRGGGRSTSKKGTINIIPLDMPRTGFGQVAAWHVTSSGALVFAVEDTIHVRYYE